MVTGTKIDPATVIAQEQEAMKISEEEKKLIAQMSDLERRMVANHEA